MTSELLEQRNDAITFFTRSSIARAPESLLAG